MSAEPRPRRSRAPWIAGALAAVAGLAGGFVARPILAPDPRLDELADRLAAQAAATTKAKAHGEELQGDLDAALAARRVAEAGRRDAETARTALADRAADADAALGKRATATASVAAAIQAAVGAPVMVQGDEVHVVFAERALFKPGDDQLTDKGAAALAALAVALRDVPDRDVAVQGHTTEAPPPAPAPKRPPRGPAPPPPRPQTAWELSAARALAVVHYLQEKGQLAPARLSALAFGGTRPVARAPKGQSGRVEIVIAPRAVTAP